MEPKLRGRLPIKVDRLEKVDLEFCRVPPLRVLVGEVIRSNPCQACTLQVTNRDLLEILFTIRHESCACVVPRLYKYCTDNKVIDIGVSLKPFWKKISALEKKFQSLRKAHNARCVREGSHQHEQFTSFLNQDFFSKKSVSNLRPEYTSQLQVPQDTSDVCITPAPAGVATGDNTPANSKTPSTGNSTHSSVCVQVSSPQIKTQGQLRRMERKARRRIQFQNQEIDKLKKTVHDKDSTLENVEVKRRKTAKTLKDTCSKVTALHNTCKQLAADNKKYSRMVQGRQSSTSMEQVSTDVIELLDENEELKCQNADLTYRLSCEKHKKRRLQKNISKLKATEDKTRLGVQSLCNKLISGEDGVECIKNICQTVSTLSGNKTILKTLAEAVSSKIPTKSANAYTDHFTLLMIELQNLGVSQSAVGQVANACSLHLCGRELDSIVSRRTAGRMVRRGGILADVQVAMELDSNASRGLRVGQDTTTRRGTEHVSTVWGIRTADGGVKYLQARVGWLPNHTADEQSMHLLKQLKGFNDLLMEMNLPCNKQLSIAHVVEFIGDHVNDKLHRNLEREHMLALQNLVLDGDLNEDDHYRLKELYKSACQQHSCAKVSRSFFQGMQKAEPVNLGSDIGKYGLKQKKGRTYEAASSKVIEFASMQLSPDYANTSSTDYNWADVYHGWCGANNKPYFRIGYVNKNRHYRHEYEACKIVQSTGTIIAFYESRRSTRDDLHDHQTLRNRDQVVYEALQNEEVRAQLVAADVMRYAFYSPFLVMVKSDRVDVLNIGTRIRAAHRFLEDIATDRDIATAVLRGERVFLDGEFGNDFTKPVGCTVYGEEITPKSVEYLQAGCLCSAEGLKTISSEYFQGGQYADPSEHMKLVMTGHEPHTDRNEGNFGQLSQQIRREPNARLQKVNSKVAMRANQTVKAARSNPVLHKCLLKTRKLERDETSVTIKTQLSNLSSANEPHLQGIRDTIVRRQSKRTEKAENIKQQVGKDGQLRTQQDLNRLCKNYSRSQLKSVLWKHVQYLKSEHPELVSANHTLFMASKDRKPLTTDQLRLNLRSIIQRLHVHVGVTDTGTDESDISDSDGETSSESEGSATDTDTETVETEPPSVVTTDIDTILTFRDIQVDSCISVAFVDRWYPGFVTEISSDESALVDFMHPVKADINCCYFQWPRQHDKMEISNKAILTCNIDMSPQGSSMRIWKLKNVGRINQKFFR